MPFFADIREDCNKNLTDEMKAYFENKYAKRKEEVKLEKTKIEEIKDLKFPI